MKFVEVEITAFDLRWVSKQNGPKHSIVKLRVRVRVKVKVKSQKSKLDPEVGVVMAWPTHHHHPPPTRQLFLSLKLLIKAR